MASFHRVHKTLNKSMKLLFPEKKSNAADNGKQTWVAEMCQVLTEGSAIWMLQDDGFIQLTGCIFFTYISILSIGNSCNNNNNNNNKNDNNKNNKNNNKVFFHLF